MKIILSLATLLLCSCAVDSPKAHDFCQIAKPVCLAPGERANLTISTKNQIDGANNTYDVECNPTHKRLCD